MTYEILNMEQLDNISVGFAGTGLGSTNNLYFNRRQGGKSMTHEEVVERIKKSAVPLGF